MSNTQTIQTIYATFGRGDIPAILSVLADDVDRLARVVQKAKVVVE